MTVSGCGIKRAGLHSIATIVLSRARRPDGAESDWGVDSRTEMEHCSLYVPIREGLMVRAVVEEAAALASLALFVGMIAVWAQVIAVM